ncbi:MAG: hypothetical protein HZA59_01295 [Hydrogenophilales bacterium]|nr:hypothetical protein [Hydrogenophilales bacterium]
MNQRIEMMGCTLHVPRTRLKHFRNNGTVSSSLLPQARRCGTSLRCG